MKPQDAINRVSERGDIVEWKSGDGRYRVRRPEGVGRDDVVHDFVFDRMTPDGWVVNGRMDPLELRNQLIRAEFELIQTAGW